MINPDNIKKPKDVNLNHTPLSLRIKFIIPLVSFIVIVIFLLMISLFYVESANQNNKVFEKRFTRTKSISGDFYKYNIESDAKAIYAILTSLRSNKELSYVLSSGDRDSILDYISPLYNELNDDYNITHFYFTGIDRVNIVRAHAPKRFGDTINRTTTINAQKSVAMSHGVELGSLGTLTLRVVSPWYSNSGEQIGYLELGMEIDHIIDRLQNILGFDIALFIHKEYLKEDTWKEGMKVLGRNIEWDQFKNLVATKQIINPFFDSFIKQKDEHNTPFSGAIQSFENKESTFWLLSVPVYDVQGHTVASLLMLANTTFESNVAQRTIVTVGIIIFILAGALLLFFIQQTNKVIHRMSHDENLLKAMASKDPLTNLYTRRIFNEHFKREVLNAKRYQTDVFIILIDVDHFKRVNDNYGHNAGDIVLKKVGELLLSLCRESDLACRFGGEEFVVLVKSGHFKEVKIMAERIRNTIENTPFDVGAEQVLSITISAGIACYTEKTENCLDIISAADEALYRAKNDGRNRIYIADSDSNSP